MTEDDATEWACNVAQGVDAQCRERADRRIGGREEQRPEDKRGGADHPKAGDTVVQQATNHAW